MLSPKYSDRLHNRMTCHPSTDSKLWLTRIQATRLSDVSTDVVQLDAVDCPRTVTGGRRTGTVAGQAGECRFVTVQWPVVTVGGAAS